MFTKEEKKRIARTYLKLQMEEDRLNRADAEYTHMRQQVEEYMHGLLGNFRVVYNHKLYELQHGSRMKISSFNHMIVMPEVKTIRDDASSKIFEDSIEKYESIKKLHDELLAKLNEVVKNRVSIKTILKGVLDGNEGILIDGYLITWNNGLILEEVHDLWVVEEG